MPGDLKTLLSDLQEAFGQGTQSWGGWAGMYGGTPGIPDGAQQAWPYRTGAAERVWEVARDLISKYPELNERGILKLAIEKSGIPPLELTPEDWRLLEMAIEWEKNGTQYVTPLRIGGSPGGPFRASEYGHEFVRTLGYR